jgi:hypothetical protein
LFDDEAVHILLRQYHTISSTCRPRMLGGARDAKLSSPTPDSGRLLMPSPSAVRVFAKSLHILAATWIISVAVLWGAELRQDARLDPTGPRDPHIVTILEGILPTLVLEGSALGVERWARSGSGPFDEGREWIHALWWSILPMVLLFETVYLTIWPG